MNDGGIAQVGSAEELYERPGTRFVAEFIGESNVIAGRIDGAWFVGPGSVRLPCPSDGSRSATLMVVRPEKLTLTQADAPGAIAGSIVGLVYVGDFTRYLVEIAGGQRLIVKAQNRRSGERMREGEAVGLLLDPADARLLTA
jgi:spermidine/putrescine transport system ATP-binding protein